jgi:hypothetical protein
MKKSALDAQNALISPQAIGVYMAYPTSDVLKPIYRLLKTQVNIAHTKVGITIKSFGEREREYRRTFQNEVTFVRVAAVPLALIPVVEAAILADLGGCYSRVGKAREWFECADREAVLQRVLAVIERVMGQVEARALAQDATNSPVEAGEIGAPAHLGELEQRRIGSASSVQTLPTSKQLGDDGERYACELLRAHGFVADLLPVNAKTYDIRAGRGDMTFFVSVKVSRQKQHVRLGARRSVLGLTRGNFVFAFIPPAGGTIETLAGSPHTLLIIPAETVREDALPVHDRYWSEKDTDANGFSVMVKGYGGHHRAIWPRWLTYKDAWHLLD